MLSNVMVGVGGGSKKDEEGRDLRHFLLFCSMTSSLRTPTPRENFPSHPPPMILDVGSLVIPKKRIALRILVFFDAGPPHLEAPSSPTHPMLFFLPSHYTRNYSALFCSAKCDESLREEDSEDRHKIHFT